MWRRRHILFYKIISCAIAAGILIGAFATVWMMTERAAPPPPPHETKAAAPPPPPAAAAPPPPSKEAMIRDAAKEQANKTLETSNIAYNTPETIQLDDTAVVQLKLSPSFSIDELKEGITEPGKKEGASIPFSRRVEAHLTGSAFKIAALGSELPREAKPGRVCEWSWQVTPTQPGTQRLFLTIDAVVAIDGRDAASYERVFARTIKVKVTLGQRVASFVGNNWQWLWTVGLVPLAGWVLVRCRKWRGQKDQSTG